MKTLFFAVALAACSAFAGARIETLENDLSKKLVPGALEITADADTTVRGRFLFAGGEYNTAGWTGLLFVGISGEGVTFTNSAAGRGFMSWDIPATMTPTNGRYAFQIFGAQGARIEEWGRGAVTVRGNPGKTALPVEWVKLNPVYVIATNALKIAQDASAAVDGAIQAATLADAIARAASVTGGLALATAAANLTTNATLTINGEVLRLVDDPSITIEGGGTTNYVETAGVVVGGQSNTIDTAWQNPASASNWSWTNNSDDTITITGYSGGAAIVTIPEILDGKPVTKLGDYAFSPDGSGMAFITRVTGKSILEVGEYCFSSCTGLLSVDIPQTKIIRPLAFSSCQLLQSINVENAEIIESGAFSACTTLRAVYFSKDAPSTDGITDVYLNSDIATNYVISATAKGWSTTWNERPVVRMPVSATDVNAGTVISITSTTTGTNSAGFFQGDGSLLTGLPSSGISAATATNIVRASIIFTNGTTLADGVYSGTNGVFFTKNSTNYWILLP